jgi:hypothetical protein
MGKRKRKSNRLPAALEPLETTSRENLHLIPKSGCPRQCVDVTRIFIVAFSAPEESEHENKDPAIPPITPKRKGVK